MDRPESPLGIGARTLPPPLLHERHERERRLLRHLAAMLAGVVAGAVGRWLWQRAR